MWQFHPRQEGGKEEGKAQKLRLEEDEGRRQLWDKEEEEKEEGGDEKRLPRKYRRMSAAGEDFYSSEHNGVAKLS